MPQGETADRTKPALALSGGGFRATLFHIGSIVRLNELGLLGKLERISSVSGGAITAGRLASAWARLLSQEGKFSNLTREVVEPLRVFCTHRIDERAIALGTLSPFSTIGEKLASIYAEELVGQLSLQDLPDKPQFVFNATNLQTGRSVRMQKVRLADYTIGEIRNPKVALATAIAASSAFPPILSPVKIACDTAAWVNRPGAIHFMDQNFCRELVLTDGGAYDNLGLETVDDFSIVIVSDAGAPFAIEEEAQEKFSRQALRTLDIATDQARGLRRRLLHSETVGWNRSQPSQPRVYALAAIDDDPNDTKRFTAMRALRADPGLVAPLARLRTRLNPFSEQEQDQLINWGWYLMDLAVRTHIAKTAPAPTEWLLPEAPLG